MSESQTITRRLTWLIEHIVLALPVHARYLGMPHVFCNLLTTRLMRLHHRLRHLIARGPLPARPPRATPRAIPANPPKPTSHNPDDYHLPTGFGWLRRVFPGSQTVLAYNQLRTLLSEPESQELITGHPTLARSLRPLCHMVGLKPPTYLKLTPRPRAKPAPRQPKPPPKPKIIRKTWVAPPPPPPMTPAMAQLAARQFLNPRDFLP